MKHIIIGVVAALLLLVGSGAARAEEGMEVEAGVKMWINEWERSVPDFGSATSDSTLLIGPTVGVKFPNRIFLDATFLFSTSDYEFSDISGSSHRDRQDFELAVGYRIIDEFGVLFGYKTSWFSEKETGIDETLFGPFLGVAGTIPVNEAFSFYGNINYLFTRFEVDDPLFGTITEDSPGWIFEGGAKYAFTREFTGTLGYKYETNKGDDSDVRDTFTGVTIGLLYTF